MKINKLMLAMAVAATTIAACNKQETTPVVESGNKSVALNIANLATKSQGTQVAEGTAVKLNSFQVFFSDGSALHAPKTVTAAAGAQTYFTGEEAVAGTYEFHFLPKAVTKVFVVGNAAQLNVTTEADLLKAVKDLSVDAQQNPEALTLLGMDATLTASGNHAADDMAGIQHPDPYVKAEVNLVPTVARFEVTGFEYAQVGEAVRDFSEMVVNNLSVRNFYTTATTDLAGVTTPGALDANASLTLNTDNIYGTYFTKLVAGAWSNDNVNATLNAANTYVHNVATVTGEGDAATSDNKCYAYQVFPGAVPQFLVSLTGKEGGISSPLYLMTSALKVGETALTTIEAGKVYRMTMVFSDDNLQAPEKCVEVVITVDDWNVIVVTPEF